MFIIELLKVLVLGIVEGITEWLPISSTGHMILVDEFIKLNVTPEYMDMFLYVIQLGAILAVVTLFFHKLNPFSPKKSAAEKKSTRVLWFKVIVAILPAMIIGLPLDDFIGAHLSNPQVVAAMLILYGILFIVVENRNKSVAPRVTDLDHMTYKTALEIGCFQVLSIIPGTSRSGSTILGGILVGASRSVAAEFSFFLAIPVMFGVSGIKILKYVVGQVKAGAAIFTFGQFFLLIFGMIVAYLVSVLAIRFLMDYVKKHDFKVFGWYRIVLGILVLLYFIIK